MAGNQLSASVSSQALRRRRQSSSRSVSDSECSGLAARSSAWMSNQRRNVSTQGAAAGSIGYRKTQLM